MMVQIGFEIITTILFFRIPKAARREYFLIGVMLIAKPASMITTMVGYHVFHIVMNKTIIVLQLLYPVIPMLVYKNLINTKRFTLIAYSLITVHLIFGITNIFSIQGFSIVNSYTNALSDAIIVSFALYYFYVLIKQLPLESSLTKQPIFWFNLAMSIVYIGTFFINTFEDYLITVMNSNFIIPLYFYHSFQLIFNIIVWYAFVKMHSGYRNREYSI